MSIHTMTMSIESGSEAGIDLMPTVGVLAKLERSLHSDECSLPANKPFFG
jgi:hypothetical protein